MPSPAHLAHLRPLLPLGLHLWDECAPVPLSLKICHIGMPKGIHLYNLTQDLAQAGVDQCVLTCLNEEDTCLPPGIPCYHYPYDSVDLNDIDTQVRLARFLDVLWRKEKPDIIHGHDFKRTALAAVMAKTRHATPLLMSPWSLESMVRADCVAMMLEKLCLKFTDWIVFSQPKAAKFLADFHRLPTPTFTRGLACSFDLEPFVGAPDYHAPPRILAGRMMRASSHQKELALCLPMLLDKEPAARVTFMQGLPLPYSLDETARVIDILRSNGCLNSCDFVHEFVPLDTLAQLLRQHNVAYTINSGDFGLSNFGIFAAVAGTLVLAGQTTLLDGIMDDTIHVIRHGCSTQQVGEALLRAQQMLPSHAQQMAIANKHMLFFDRQIQIPLLISIYNALSSKKNTKKQ